MFSVEKMFRDVERLIARGVKRRTGLNEGMQLWIDYCEGLFPAKVWAGLRKLDYEADFDRLTLWLVDLLRDEPPPPAINGLWFGLCNPCDDDGNVSSQLYVAGSKRFDKPDWHCSPEYWPAGREAPSEILPQLYRRCERLPDDANYLGEAALCHGYVSLVVARWCRGPLRTRLLGRAKSRGVAIGHDSGDVYLIDVLTALTSSKS